MAIILSYLSLLVALPFLCRRVEHEQKRKGRAEGKECGKGVKSGTERRVAEI